MTDRIREREHKLGSGAYGEAEADSLLNSEPGGGEGGAGGLDPMTLR